MVKRVILGRTGEEKIVDLITAINDKVSAGHTTPAGTKVLDDDEDFIWSRPDGTEHSVRDIDEELQGAQGRIEDAEQSLADSQVRLDDAEQTIASTAEDLTRVETVVIPAAVADLEAADQAAQEQFTELDTRLGAFATDEALAPIRQALSDAQAAVETAQGVAESANQAANAASQAALEAAGIAASKGRVIIQETEPVGEDRNAANIWIKPIPDNPDTEIEEKAITYVYLEGSNEWVPTSSDELAQAAQNALDAREAAQQAKQRADTAISNAAAAQGAAEAAQRTADQATTDAREAHNEAVAAAERAQAKIDSGESIVINGSFENGTLGWPGYIGGGWGRGGIVEDPDARTGAHVLELIPHDANAYPETDFYAVEPGQVLRVRGWIKHLGGDGRMARLLVREHDANKDYTRITYPTATTDVQSWTVGEWVLGEGDFTVPEGTRWLRFAFHVSGPSTSTYHCDDFQVVDVTAAVAAQKAADAAMAEAEARATPEEVTAAANAAETAAKTAAAADAKAKADQAKADALAGAATDATSKAAAAEAAAVAEASRDAAAKANKALSDALAALATARGEITAEIKTSANGKNSITRSTSNASGSGVVAGDAWYKVDSNGDTMAMWIWSGSAWVASKVRNEMIDTIDVNKLKVHGSAEMDSAVIDKLWADGIAARSVTAGSVTVSPGNMISWNHRGNGSEDLSPHKKYGTGAEYIRWGYDSDMGGKVLTVNMAAGETSSRFFMQLHPDVPATDLVTEFGGNPFPVRGGSSYRLEFGLGRGGNYPDGSPAVRASFYVYDHAGTRISIISAGDLKRPNGSTTPLFTKPERHGATVTLPEEAAFVNVFLSASNSGFIYMFEPELRPLTGAVLIEDGAITTPKLQVTGDMSAAIVNAMTTNTKKLVVTEEAILNHATLIGDTVVDNINVNGKLVGTNGVFTGTVDFANVNVTGEVLADKILADKGLVAGGPDGQVVIDGAGVTRYETDSDGQQIETFRLGPQGGDIATFGDTTISPEGIGSPEGAFEQLSVGGESLEAILAALPRGVRAWGQLTTSSAYDSSLNRVRRAELQTTLLPDRLYRISISSRYLQHGYSAATWANDMIHYSFDQTNIHPNNPGTGVRQGVSGRHLLSGGYQLVPSMEFYIDTEGWSGERHFWAMYSIQATHSSAGIRVFAGGTLPVTLMAEDIGPSQPGTLKRWNDNNEGGSQDTTPTTRRYTKTYTSTGHNTYDSDGSPSSPKPADVVQGLYGGGPSRLRRRGGWSFPSFTSDLSGATVEKIEAYVYMNHSYYGAGADVNIATHNGTLSNLTSRVSVKGWKRNSGKWVTLPKSLYNGFKNGTYKGVGVISTNSTAQQYARFNGSGAKIRITYVK